MWPVLFKIGNFEIGTFGLMAAVGFFAAYWIATKRAEEAGLSGDRFANLVVVSLLGGILGAKLLFVGVYFRSAPLLDLVFSRSGLVYYGGLIGGVGAGWFCTWKNGWDPAHVADIVAPAIPLGHFFGRIGCLLNGCCYGKICHHSFGISFPKILEDGQVVGSEPFVHQLLEGHVHADSSHSLPVYPTQIMSSLGGLATFLFLQFYLSKRQSFKGQLAVSYLLIYSVFRFCIEAFRDDPRGAWPGGLSTSQGIAVILGIFALAIWRPLQKRSQKTTNLGEEK
jgi:phosphatidylglycerol:prolipoprotein diacylglycerol transferase